MTAHKAASQGVFGAGTFSPRATFVVARFKVAGRRRTGGAGRRGESLAAINRRMSANWPAIIEAARQNTKRLTGRETL